MPAPDIWYYADQLATLPNPDVVLVWADHWPDWKHARDVPKLEPTLASLSPTVGVATRSSEPTKSERETSLPPPTLVKVDAAKGAATGRAGPVKRLANHTPKLNSNQRRSGIYLLMIQRLSVCLSVLVAAATMNTSSAQNTAEIRALSSRPTFDCTNVKSLTARAEGTIDSIERFANDQGVNITVVTGKRDQNGEMLTIVNSFDELDGPPSKFFEAAKPDVYHLSQDDVQRIIAALMVMEDSDAELGHPEEAQKSRELAARLKAASGGN